MPDLPQPDAVQPDPAAERFYGLALERIKTFMLLIGAAATVVVWAVLGWQYGIGVLLGCVLAWVNFHWLTQAVTALADGIAAAPTVEAVRRRSGRAIVSRFLLRYALIVLAAYVIFRVSKPSLYGLLGGLFLTVAAILCEAVFEAYVALRRGL